MPQSNPLIPNSERRYIVGWEKTPEDRYRVFVYDKVNNRVVYIANCKERKKAYPYIAEHYGEDSCVPPKELVMKEFE